jgi:hypothetical protein
VVERKRDDLFCPAGFGPRRSEYVQCRPRAQRNSTGLAIFFAHCQASSCPVRRQSWSWLLYSTCVPYTTTSKVTGGKQKLPRFEHVLLPIASYDTWKRIRTYTSWLARYSRKRVRSTGTLAVLGWPPRAGRRHRASSIGRRDGGGRPDPIR